MNKYILLATVGDRANEVERFITTANQFFPDWPIVFVGQAYAEAEAMRLGSMCAAGCMMLTLPQRIGTHRAKQIGVKRILSNMNVGGAKNFIICSVDDDMEFIPETNFDKCIAKAQEPGVGFVSAGWVQSRSRLDKRKPVDEFIKQPIVYTGGGLVFDRKMAQLVSEMPALDYFSDNVEWSLASYLAGYENYRYRGSLTVHKGCAKGGRRKYMETGQRVLSDPEYLTTYAGSEKLKRANNYLIGGSEDLTEKAKRVHMANIKG